MRTISGPVLSNGKDLRWSADEDCEFWRGAKPPLCSEDGDAIPGTRSSNSILSHLVQIVFVGLVFLTRFFRRFGGCFLLTRLFQSNLRLAENCCQSSPEQRVTLAAAITSKCFGRPSSIDESDPPSSLEGKSIQRSAVEDPYLESPSDEN